ncbi:undecaprenyl/decaprenyl-phosphate alpha-N-acetylglucosaminyl 1-phosphate transferase [Candidatus Woesebacteria bacterium]|nr:undecaprenyl/decaprenyl-phosphate alpha-N-acetylglucosaminyl 1-phosphate transferase [Candidatus Woesebacteria bacterium]
MNQYFLLHIVLPFLVTAAISYAVTPLVISLAWKIGIIDDPKKSSHPKTIHTKPIPRGGGLAIGIALFVASLIFLPLNAHLKGILSGALILVVMGLIDDKKNLNPYLRLLVQFVAAACPIIAGIGISYISNPTGGIIDVSNPQLSFELFGQTRTLWILSDLFALLWIVTLMNFINMGAKGVAGQLTGVVMIAALFIAVLSLQYSADIAEWPVTILSAITAGAFAGFLPFHVEPQKIMPSFAGSNLAGFMLGVLSILTTTKVGTLAVVLAVPLIDTFYTVIRRILQGKSPVWGDRGHLHHKLLDRGWSTNRIAYFYWAVTAMLGIVSLYLNTGMKLLTILLIGVTLAIFLIWIQLKKRSSD